MYINEQMGILSYILSYAMYTFKMRSICKSNNLDAYQRRPMHRGTPEDPVFKTNECSVEIALGFFTAVISPSCEVNGVFQQQKCSRQPQRARLVFLNSFKPQCALLAEDKTLNECGYDF